jgi:CHAT domain
MSDAAWALFDRRAQGDYTRVVVQIKALLLAPAGEWELASVPTDELERVAKVTRSWLLAPTTAVASAQHADLARLDNAVEAALRARAGAELPGDVPSPDKLEAFSELLNARAVLLADPPEASEAVVREIRRLEGAGADLRAREPVRYLADELASILFELARFEAQMLSRASAPGTRAAYERAIQAADRFGLATEADATRLELAQHLFAVAATYDEALALILPQHEAMLAGDASLERAQLALLLARLYVDLPSLQEARDALEAAAADLAGVGYPRLADPPDPTPWFEAADQATASGAAFRATVIAVAEAHFTLAGLETRLATAEDEAAAGRAQLARLEALSRTIVDHVQAAGAEEERTVAALAPPEAAAASVPPRDQELPARQRKLIESHGLLLDRVNADAAAVDLKELRECRREAETLAAEAVAINLLGLEGQVLDARGCRDDACVAWREAFDRAKAAGRLGDALWWLDWIAHAHFDPPDHERVSALAGEAIALIEAHRTALTPAYLASDFLHRKDHFYRVGIAAARKLGDVGLMLERGELIKSRGIVRQGLAGADNRPPEALDEEIADITGRLAAARGEQAESLRERRRVLWDWLAIERARASGAALPPRFDLAALQGAIDDDTLVIDYLWLERGVLLVIGIDRTGVVESLQLVDEDYDALLAAIDEFSRLDRPPNVLAATDRFAGVLVPDPIVAMLDGKRRCILSPHQHLHLFPFHALRVNGDYLIRQVAVSYVPNLTVLLLQRPPSRSHGVLGVGTGSFNVPGLALAELPGVAAELAALRELYERRGIGAEFLVGGDATVAAVRALAASGRLADFRLVHVATHGSDVDGDSPMEATLALSDGVLDGLEIAGFRLDADLVLLTACFSGKRAVAGREMSATPGDDLFGLQAAFFAAGARAVLGALWPVPDRAAQRIVPGVHERLGDRTPPEALREAVLEYLDGAGVLSADPYYWAPFFVSSLLPTPPR